MIKRIGHILALLMLALGCADDSFQGTSADMYGNGSQYVPVMVALGDPSGGILKGSGAVDDMEEWDGRHIYVYAFNKHDDYSFLAYSRANQRKCLIDGSLKDEYSIAGRKARILADDVYAEWEDDDVVYYPSGDYQKIAYDFFAYYVDDMELVPQDFYRGSDAVKINLEIDGSQDLMSSKAEVTQEQLKPFTTKDQLLIKENAHSFYTAQRNVVPTFLFQHHLARLEFELVAGVVREESKRIIVHAMEVESQCMGSFTIAAKDASRMGVEFNDVIKPLAVKEEEGGMMLERMIVTRPSQDVVRENVKLGGGLLVAPKKEYDAYMIMTELRDDGSYVVERVRTPLLISYGGGFEPGNQYRVKLTVYGATQVSASVELEPWHHGGNIDMDTENDKPII